MPIKEHVHDNGSKTIETYSDDQLLLQLEDVCEDGTLSLRVAYRYDNDRNNIERIVTRGNGTPMRRLAFTFDANHRPLGYEEFDGADTLVYRFHYDYGQPGGKIRVRVFDPHGQLLKESLEDVV